MFSELYPHLNAKYNIDNFEVIFEALEKHFSDIFQLNVLEDIAKSGQSGGSYERLFDKCMHELADLYTVEEVVTKLYRLMKNSEIAKDIETQFIFIPSVGHQPSKQFGFLEKIAVDTLKVGEPISFVDMIRLVNGIKQFNPGKSKLDRNVSVVQLNHLIASEQIRAEFLKNSHALLINLNRDVRGIPKWGVIDLTKEPLTVYCETPLTEREKSELQSVLNTELSENQFLGAAANSLPSTGYTAISWLDNNITKVWDFDVNADFVYLLKNIIMLYTGGDNPGLDFSFTQNERTEYCTEHFKKMIASCKRDENGLLDNIKPGFVFGRFAHLLPLGALGDHVFRPGDLSKIIQIVGAQNWSLDDISSYCNKGIRTLPYGFIGTLTTYPNLVTETERSVKLNVSGNLDIDGLRDYYKAACAKAGANNVFFDTLFYQIRRAGSQQEFYATMLLLAFVRSKAKKRELIITLPAKFRLIEEELQFIIKNLSENPYVTELTINEDNSSLAFIKKALIPALARNRWLAAKGYRPPLVDDYWRQTAQYWIVHLYETPSILAPKEEHELFKRCILEMGLTGLNELLGFLNDESNHEYVQNIYGSSKPAFYAACTPEVYPEYLDVLLNYLKTGSYFPFSELGISYQPGNNQRLVSLVDEINKLEQFEKTTFTECLKNPKHCKEFLEELIKAAQEKQWVGLIVIPELEDQESASNQLRELRVMYTFLNDVILHNRHLSVAVTEIKKIQEQTDFTMPGAQAAASSSESMNPAKAIEINNQEITHISESSLNQLAGDSKWPLKKGGVVQLQLQQQQQIEQVRQIQQEQQKMVMNTLEEAITSELVDYDNIDRLLTKFFKEFEEENPVKESAATLKTESESPLQGFFHTWINANPQTNATHVIKQMTPDAAKALLRHHSRLPSGLNPENLPKGFYTQQSKDKHLILCYSPELSYINLPNALTLNFNVNIPKAEAWEGDFRQFDLAKYDKYSAQFSTEDWQNMILFAQLQPPQANYDGEFDEFLWTSASLKGTLEEHKDKIKRHWLVFLQAWQYAGEKGVDQFIARSDARLTLTIDNAKELILSKINSPELRQWSNQIEMDERYLRALGQIYYRFGDLGVTTFLSKLRQLEAVLGADFFDHFNKTIIAASDNFNCFINTKFFVVLDEMMAKLKPHDAAGNLLAWKVVMEKHMKAVGWENIDILWHGFEYFVAELTQLGLKLEGNEFDAIKPENMLVAMDRILKSLNQIPDMDMQQNFLQSLADLDLTYGGVHYALQHDGFKYFDRQLELHDFVLGAPTYSPDLTSLYLWPQDQEAELKMKRTLASQSQLSQQAYRILIDKLSNSDIASRHQLMWLLHTQYNAADMDSVVQSLDEVAPGFQELIAQHLHQAVYELGNKQLAIDFQATKELESFAAAVDIVSLLEKYPHGTLLEAASILYQKKRWSNASVQQLTTLLSAPLLKPPAYPDYLAREAYKLATLFSISNPDKLLEFYNTTSDLRPVVQNELRLLINQLLSINYATSDLSALDSAGNWDLLLECIKAMKGDLAHAATHRIAFIEQLNTQGLQFKYSKSGDLRVILNQPADRPADLGYIVDHEDRLWTFMQKHLLVPVQGDAKDSLKPLMRFFKKLQLNRTYLNEIEPLLSSLETAQEGRYWSATYFYQLLRALQPEDDQMSFPISLIKVMLQEETIAPKLIDSVEKEFPALLIEPLQLILRNSVFDREQQATLCQIVLREYNWQGNVSLLQQIMSTLSTEGYAESRSYALAILAKSTNFYDLEKRFESCRWLLQHQVDPRVADQWTQTTALWLKALSERKQEEDLFAQIKSQFEDSPLQLSLVLHIVAFSTLRQGLGNNESYLHELNKKATKLVNRLAEMEEQDLIELARAYPQEPSPSADDILRLIKKQKTKNISWSESLDTYNRQPFPEPRTDYGLVSDTRDADLQRMIADTNVSSDQAHQGLSAEKSAQLTLIFSYLKQLESGKEFLDNSKKPISKMTQEELAKAFHAYSKVIPQDDITRTKVWAILFEVLGRTTRKYPHLAQQFALISNDIAVTSSTRVLQLLMGEGKSHYVAMRAIRHAGQGLIVDVCTAKRSLAERDLQEYKNVYDYLGITTAYIHPKSSHASYMDNQVHYSTLGDLSLFLDEQSYTNQPIVIDPQHRVALFDEFDFIRFEEGRKTEYNYARPTGKTPKQMTWFYQAVNDFYTSNSKQLVDSGEIDLDMLRAFAKSLIGIAGENEEKQHLIHSILRDPMYMVQWLQSAHEAHTLEWGVGFTVRELNIKVGDESYPMREVIPLSSDNQKMEGSTFSAGVHQLLAVRLNTEARIEGKPQNFHIHPESNIISSQIAAQRMNELWAKWEGFSGTISAAQMAFLNKEYGTQVLHVPTNQNDLRFWHKPAFYRNDEARITALVQQIRTCIENKQSILFSCKNDKKVEQLKDILKGKFSAEELDKHFIFYTNEESRGAPEVLADKFAKESWHGGKKQHAVGLVASGFGRGDNVGVEAVFLFDVNDTNDLLQKGGRTARNGAEGEVFQFYLVDELKHEEERLWEVLTVIVPEEIENLKEKLNEVVGETDDERLFERIMLLREYVFTLQNAANQGYHNALAQYSSWGMKALGIIDDPAVRQELTTKFSFQLKKLDKLWIGISSQQQLSVDEKIEEIEKQINTMSIEFNGRCNEEELEITPFELAPRKPNAVNLVVPEPPRKPTAKDRAVASICSVMSHLPDLLLTEHKVSTIPQDLERLAASEGKLLQFAKRITSCTSAVEFMHKLKLSVMQIESPSEAWAALEDAASILIDTEELFVGVSDSVKVRCALAFDGLLPDLQSQIITALGANNLVSAEARINEALPIIEYLGTFTLEQQNNWGSEFISKMGQLHQSTTPKLLSLRLNTSHPMSYSHFTALGAILAKTLTNTKALNDNELFDLYSQLDRSVAVAPEQRIRMLAKWEAWMAFLPKEEVKPFLMTFCYNMEHFKEGENWDTFSTLVKKTQDWWNKGGEHAYVPELITLWNKLGQRIDELPDINEFLQLGMKFGGKTWFQLINTTLDIAPAHVLRDHVHQIKGFWETIDQGSGKKQDKLEKFRLGCDGINQFYAAIKVFALPEQNRLTQQFTALDDDKFNYMIGFINDTQTLTSCRPHAFKAMLAYFNDNSISLSRGKLLGQVILQAAHYQEQHPDIAIEHLLNGIERFKDCNEKTLALLLQLMKQTPDYDHTVEPLFDNTVFYLDKHVAPAAKAEVQEVIQEFYAAAKKQRGVPKNIDASIRFDFADKTSKEQNRRISLMHLLQQQVFVTTKASLTDNHDYLWSVKQNEQMAEFGFNQYMQHTQTLLDAKPAKPHVGKVRDLTVKQQDNLLQLTDELAVIGKPRLALVPDATADKAKNVRLAADLTKIVNKYHYSLFKSIERIGIGFALKEQVSQIAELDAPGYQAVLETIRDAKKFVMERDLDENERPDRWFKVHRSGQSRLYNTLNQMQDMVLRHWSQDKVHLNDLIVYQEYNKQEFKDLVGYLDRSIKHHCATNYLPPDDPKYNDLKYRADRFFGTKRKSHIESLNTALQTFQDALNGGDIKADSVRELMSELRHDVAQLPGHIKTLANEVLARGDSLLINLDQKPDLEGIQSAFKL